MLDAQNQSAVNDPYRGFFVLFWICLACMVLAAFMQSFDDTGHFVSLTLATLMSRDMHVLAISDAILVAHTFLAVPLVRIIKYFGLVHRVGIAFILSVWYLGLLAGVIYWSRFRDWPWVQSGFFVLHSLVQLMKIHSYMDVNLVMNNEFVKLRETEKRLLASVVEAEGVDNTQKAWDRAMEHTFRALDKLRPDMFSNAVSKDAFLKWANLDVQTGSSNVRAHVLLPLLHNGIPRSRSPVPEYQRMVTAINSDMSDEDPQTGSLPKLEMDLRDVHPFIWHPNPKVQALSHELSTLRESLYAMPAPGQNLSVMWPYNVTFANFLDFQLIPTLVYKLNYPRRSDIRVWYVLERCVALFGTFLVTYVITVNWIIPVTEDKSASLLSVCLRLMAPMIMCYLMLFYLMFECVCQGFAEITRFADREFYQDWWNSTSMEEFARKWNRPVHHFLLQHVYLTLVFSANMSKSSASMITFLLSSVLHELVMIIVTGKIRGYLFLMQMSQLPLMLLARMQFIRRNPLLGNILFWIGLLIGMPILNILYIMF